MREPAPHNLSFVRLPQRVGEQPVADLLVPNQERPAVVLSGQGQKQSEPARRDAGGLQRFARPQPRAPVLLQDRHGWHTASNPGGRRPLYWILGRFTVLWLWKLDKISYLVIQIFLQPLLNIYFDSLSSESLRGVWSGGLQARLKIDHDGVLLHASCESPLLCRSNNQTSNMSGIAKTNVSISQKEKRCPTTNGNPKH